MDLPPNVGPREDPLSSQRHGAHPEQRTANEYEKPIINEIWHFTDYNSKSSFLKDSFQNVQRFASQPVYNNLQHLKNTLRTEIDSLKQVDTPDSVHLRDQYNAWLTELNRVNTDSWMALDKLCSCMLKL